MGQVIDSGAAIEDIEKDVRATHRTALEQRGDIAAAATTRLGPGLAAMDGANAILTGARAAEAAAWTAVLARDGEADAVIGATRDEMWNAIDRAKRHPAMDHAFPGGIGTYTSGSPTGQPVLMQVLAARIGTAEAAAWTDTLRAGWVARIDAAREPLQAAVVAHGPLAAAREVAESGRRAAVRSAHARLVSLKRDLKSLGLAEAQIHEIIPDRPRPKRKRGAGGPAPES